MTGRGPDARRRQRRAAVWITATVLGGGVWAQSVGDAPKPVGFPAGPIVIAPSLTAGYAYDSNVFLNAAGEESPDQVLTLQPALALTVPFSNSTFRLADSLSWVDYQQTPQVAGKTSNDAVAELNLNFGSLDRLDLSARHISGVAETTAFDQGGEVAFRGNAYRLHTERVSVSREVEGARGYRFGLEYNALRFDPSVEVQFFDYRGFTGEGAYLQPLSANTRLVFGYLGTRYDHFSVVPTLDSTDVFRTENGDAVYAQIEGRLGPKQPYNVRLGWERLAFEGNAAKDFSGLIGQATLSAIVGGGTILTVMAQRQPYRSFFQDNDDLTVDNNFYVFDQIGGRVDRPFPRGSSVGGNLSLSRNSYGEPTAGILRRDRTVFLEAYANLAIRDRVVFRVSFLKNRRYSNFPDVDYNDTVVFGGFVLGWI